MLINKSIEPIVDSVLTIKTIDLHTGGEPLRVVVDGLPPLLGASVIEKRTYMQDNLDHIRTFLMWEPRGHADMYGCIITEPNDEGAAFGVIFIHNEGYSTMCGHAIIALGKLASELGWVSEKIFAIDAPCGRIQVERLEEEIQFVGVPSFVYQPPFEITLPNEGTFHCTIAYGGAFYVYVTVRESRLALIPENYQAIKQLGYLIKKEVQAAYPVKHPFTPELSFLYGTIFIGGPVSIEADTRNVCVFADAEVDRSPTGSGVMGRLAIGSTYDGWTDQLIKFESITGSIFSGQIIGKKRFGRYDAIIPKVGGTAYITGTHTFVLDPNDPIQKGFFLKSI